MELTEIAQSGVRVSPLGLGTVKLGRNQGVKYPRAFALPDDKQAAAILARARDLGINLLDTAPAYGTSEQRLGDLLSGQRKHWVLCTKVGEEFDDGQSHFDFSPEHIVYSVERSLRRLQTDYLDLVLVHSNGEDSHIIQHYGALEQLAALKQAGKIRAFGMSTKTVEGGILAAANSDCVMVTYNLDYRDEVAVLEYCAQHGKGVLIKKALGSGHLSNTEANPVLANLRFIFRHPAVSSAVLGTINLNHLADNVSTYKQALLP